jgi:MoaA/NifB/PqqE/SkfB family radical SAM enzyme
MSPTLRCNLECKGCFAANYLTENDLSLDVLEKIVSQSGAMGVPSFGVIGGEPLLVPDIFKLFKKFPEKGFYLVTNGTMVDDKVIEALRGLPNVVTIFSIEGFRETNDALRGEGVFDKVMATMKKMKEAGLIFGFSTVVHKENMNEVVTEEYFDFMIDQGCCFCGILAYIPVGIVPKYHAVCNREQVSAYYKEIDRITSTRPLLVLKEGYSDGTFLNKGCASGHTIHITAGGEAEPCNGIEFFTHNINDSGVQDIFMSDFFKDIRKLHPENERRCLAITDPEGILKVVKKHNAKPTHARALEHLEEYVSVRAGGSTQG